MENLIYKNFLLIIGSTQVLTAVMEFISPLRSFVMWKVWIFNRFFPFHGAALIFVGLPLTLYKGYLSSIIFYIGLIVVFTGPLILIYPEKIRKAFDDTDYTFKSKDIKIIMYVDAFFRLSAGFIFFISCWKTFF